MCANRLARSHLQGALSISPHTSLDLTRSTSSTTPFIRQSESEVKKALILQTAPASQTQNKREEKASPGCRDKAHIVPQTQLIPGVKNNMALHLRRDKAFLGHSQLSGFSPCSVPKTTFGTRTPQLTSASIFLTLCSTMRFFLGGTSAELFQTLAAICQQHPPPAARHGAATAPLQNPNTRGAQHGFQQPICTYQLISSDKNNPSNYQSAAT